MTIGSRLSLVVLLGLAGEACSGSSNENDGGVFDARSEARGGRPNLVASPAMLGFGSVCPGGVSAPRMVRVMNNGDVTATVAVRVATGIHSADFIITATDCERLAPGEACTVTLVFAPTTEPGPAVAMLEVSAVGGNSINISLDNVSTGGPAPFSFAPTQFDFGGIAVGATSSPVTFPVTVSGERLSCARDAAVMPFAVTLSSDEFFITNDTCSANVIPIGQSCSFSVVFKPIAAGPRYASLVVGWPSSYVRAYPLTGTGTSVVDAAPEPMDWGFEQGQ